MNMSNILRIRQNGHRNLLKGYSTIHKFTSSPQLIPNFVIFLYHLKPLSKCVELEHVPSYPPILSFELQRRNQEKYHNLISSLSTDKKIIAVFSVERFRRISLVLTFRVLYKKFQFLLF